MTPKPKSRPIASIKGALQGRRAVLLANGPTLTNHDLTRLAPDVAVIGCNRSWQVWPEPAYHVIVEPRHLRDHPDVYQRLDAAGRLVVAGPRNVLPLGSLRIDLRPAVRGKRGVHAFSTDLASGAVLSVDGVGSVVYVALQLALWLGVREVHALGLDLGGPHFHGEWAPSLVLAEQDRLFKLAAEALAKPPLCERMRVYVCGSPESLCTAFPKSEFQEVRERRHRDDRGGVPLRSLQSGQDPAVHVRVRPALRDAGGARHEPDLRPPAGEWAPCRSGGTVNHNTGYVAMSREHRTPGWVGDQPQQATTACEHCGTVLAHGAWPWCRDGKHPEDHQR